jgi:peptidoglycan/xylan/chitin deacetylase (PgdA/CDA1 family)
MRLPLVLMYHSIQPYQWDPFLITVHPARFERQMRWLYRSGRRGVSMRELLAARSRGAATDLVGLTFDDGYRDFAEHALPVLRRYRFTATVFVVAERIGGRNEWDADGPPKEIMADDEIRRIDGAGMEIGSHGLRHVRLSATCRASLRAELVCSRQILESVVRHPVRGFCYPYGDLDRRAVEEVRRVGYDYACAVGRSALDGRHAIPRTYVGDRDAWLRLTAKNIRHQLVHRKPVPA